MDKTEVDKTDSKAPYTITVDDNTYRFKRPSVPQLDRYISRASDKAVSTGKTFTLELVVDEDREVWLTALGRKPGLSTAVVKEIMEDLGFTMENS